VNVTPSVRWLLTTVGGVALVFLGGLVASGGSNTGLALIAAGAGGFVIGRLFSLPVRRRHDTTFRGSRRAADAATRQGLPPAPVEERSQRR
jgi:hypothetical protein